MKRKTILATTLVVAAAGFTACAYTSPEPGTFECVYEGGTFDGKNFERVVDEGAGRTDISYGASTISIPTSTRQFDAGDGMEPITVSVRGVPLTWSPSLTFTIASYDVDSGDGFKAAGCELYEQHLRTLDATDFDQGNIAESRWVQRFLRGRIEPVVRTVAPLVLQDQDPTALAFNTDGLRDKLAKEFGEELKKKLNEQLGGDFLCAPSYRYKGSAEDCGLISVVLPEPTMSDADRELIARPQRAKTEADNEIAVAAENARKAEQVATQLETQADSAERAANARVKIEEQNNRVAQTKIEQEYQWCAYLTSLGQDCALVKAAENSNFPTIFTGEPPQPVVPVGGE